MKGADWKCAVNMLYTCLMKNNTCLFVDVVMLMVRLEKSKKQKAVFVVSF